ncbi:MAG: hypothetical protein M1816_006791 [Peltula sp. TS41687]|nr:MAG: hypothetical protein M1816_006791 [Peltula sp. TS41687]
MHLTTLATTLGSLAYLSKVSAHGIATALSYEGQWYGGVFQDTTRKNAIGWPAPEDHDTGFVNGKGYQSPDIICHKGAVPGPSHAKVAAGGTVNIHWTTWPASKGHRDGHHGAVIDYLANCNGPCEKANKNDLKFFKIDAEGMYEDATGVAPWDPGYWAGDKLGENNKTWAVTIPLHVAPGNYVLRHEPINLQSAGKIDGAQHYPQCFNLEITGSGTDRPAGVPATELYKNTDPGLSLNIYMPITSYHMPGPAMYTGGSGGPAVKYAAEPTSTFVSGYAVFTSDGPSSSATAKPGSSASSAGDYATFSVPEGYEQSSTSSSSTAEAAEPTLVGYGPSSAAEAAPTTTPPPAGYGSPTTFSTKARPTSSTNNLPSYGGNIQDAAGADSADDCPSQSTETVVETKTVTVY